MRGTFEPTLLAGRNGSGVLVAGFGAVKGLDIQKYNSRKFHASFRVLEVPSPLLFLARLGLVVSFVRCTFGCQLPTLTTISSSVDHLWPSLTPSHCPCNGHRLSSYVVCDAPDISVGLKIVG